MTGLSTADLLLQQAVADGNVWYHNRECDAPNLFTVRGADVDTAVRNRLAQFDGMQLIAHESAAQPGPVWITALGEAILQETGRR